MNIPELYRTIRYLLSPRPLALEKPVVLQFPVIDICNSQCQMCRIWENKKSDDLTPEQLRKGLRNSLFSEVSGVGLNGGEPTLRKDLGELTAVLFEELPKLRSISLITNAYKYEEVIARISDVGQFVKHHGGVLDVMISLDGFGELHDKVRGKPGNFERAQRVIEFAKASPLVDNVRIGCTIIKENVFGLSELLEFCISKGLYIKYRLGIPHQRLYTQNLLDPYALNANEKYHIAEFLEGLITHYETSEHQKFFYRSLIDQIIHRAPRKAGCDWKHRGATITSSGELLYCAVQSKVLGNITEHNSEKRFFGNESHLKEIIHNHCDNCNHDYVGIPPRAQHFKQFVMQVASKLDIEHVLRKVHKRVWRSESRRAKGFSSQLERLTRVGSVPMEWPKGGRGKRILVCGWYGTETLGDKAILGGVLKALRSYFVDIDVVLVSLFPYVSEMTRRQMDELKGVTIVDRETGVQMVSNAELLVFGGGPLMAIDETADMLAMFETAKRAGCKTLVAGCGVGPLGTPWQDAAIGKLLTLADARIYRDEPALKMAHRLGVDVTNDLVAEDPAFTWLRQQTNSIQKTSGIEGEKVLLLGLRDFPYSSYARHLNESECQAAKTRYEEALISALKQLIVKYPGLVVRPLPMCTNHFGDDDRWFYRKLFRGHDTLKPNLDLSLLGAELSPVTYCKEFGEATVALTMRFHSVVFALGLGVPTVAIDYTLGLGKVHALATRFDVPNRSLVELDSDFIVREVSRQLDRPEPQARDLELSFENNMVKALSSLIPIAQNLEKTA